MLKRAKRNTRQASLIEKTADLTGFSKRHVRYVIDGDRVNDQILDTYMHLMEGENMLLEAVKTLVPFDKINKN